MYLYINIYVHIYCLIEGFIAFNLMLITMIPHNNRRV